MFTEKDAREKWCPMTLRGDVNLGGAENRPDGSYNCIASDCMMWRKFDQIGIEQDGKAQWISRGYCGLAGWPEPNHRS